MKKNLSISLQIIKFAPLIVFRYFKYLFFKKSLHITDFRPSNIFCIDGTLNQLIWNVENCLFVILKNTSKVYLGSNDLIFKVAEQHTQFSLKSYGYNKTIQANTNIKVISLKQKNLDNEILKNNVLTIKKHNPRLVHSKNINRGLRKTSRLSFLKSKSIKISKNIKKVQLTSSITPFKELREVNNYKTIHQLNNHHHE
ncbi:hypothetical protein [Algibacter sp. 2305UL17-15]|uniref:hypothetical protein n=1 Tax=Algibacter sp. 2305UL17-15 TaxID=3231268 RepID=UPI00345A663D